MIEKASEADERGSTLLKAAKSGDEDTIFKWLLNCRDDLDVHETSPDGYTALHYAAEKGFIGILRMLLLAGADVNARSGEPYDEDGEIVFRPGYTALMLAARYSHTLAVDLLLASAADPHIHSDQGWTALHAAATGGDVSIMETLLSLNVDWSVASTERCCEEELGWYLLNTPMHIAASVGNALAIACLLKHEASPDDCWGDNRTPIFYAAAFGHHEVIRVLCEHGVDPNIRESRRPYNIILDCTPLHYAARNGHIEAVKTLLEFNADPLAKESNLKQTALEAAESEGHFEIVRILKSAKKR